MRGGDRTRLHGDCSRSRRYGPVAGRGGESCQVLACSWWRGVVALLVWLFRVGGHENSKRVVGDR